jgi:hypothetical protein
MVVFAGVLGVVFALIRASFVKRKTFNLIQAVGMAGITMTLGLWTTEGTTTILNNGLLPLIILLFWGGLIEERRRSSYHREKYLRRDSNFSVGAGNALDVLEGVR